jgi:hypothetical protein
MVFNKKQLAEPYVKSFLTVFNKKNISNYFMLNFANDY